MTDPLDSYVWAGPTPPYAVQRKTVAMMVEEARCYVLNSMGTGKTRCTLWAFDALRLAGLANKMLVVAPLSTLRFTWAREVFEVFPHLRCTVLFGTKEKRLELLAGEWDVAVINHDGIKTIFPELMARKDIDVVAIDELSTFRNGNTDRSKAMVKLAEGKSYVWGLTGSPLPREVTDVWGQARIVTPNRVPRYFARCREELMWKDGPYRWTPKENAIDKAFWILQPSVRFSLDDVVELPAQVMQMVEVQLGPEQKRIYKEMAAAAVAETKAGTIDALNAGAALNKLTQIALGYVYMRDGTAVALDNDDRLQAIVDAIHEASKKVLLFVPYKSAIKGLSERLTKENIEHCTVSGDTPANIRSDLFTLFQGTSKYKVLLAHPRCLSHGITLTAADTVIWAAPYADLEVFSQANARVHRIGQQHKTLVLMIAGSAVERRVYRALARKEQVQNQLLDLLEGSTE